MYYFHLSSHTLNQHGINAVKYLRQRLSLPNALSLGIIPLNTACQSILQLRYKTVADQSLQWRSALNQVLCYWQQKLRREEWGLVSVVCIDISVIPSNLEKSLQIYTSATENQNLAHCLSKIHQVNISSLQRGREKGNERENKDFVSNAFCSIKDKKEYPINTPL